jgi:hypothetical protein
VTAGLRNGRFCCLRAGDHLYGRFCLSVAFPSSRLPYFHTCASQIGADGLSTHSRGLLDLPRRSSQSSQRYDLPFLLVLQDIRHIARGYLPSRCCQCPAKPPPTINTRLRLEVFGAMFCSWYTVGSDGEALLRVSQSGSLLIMYYAKTFPPWSLAIWGEGTRCVSEAVVNRGEPWARRTCRGATYPGRADSG